MISRARTVVLRPTEPVRKPPARESQVYLTGPAQAVGRACFLCGQLGWCEHREPAVIAAELHRLALLALRARRATA